MANQPISFSIIVPTYNRPEQLTNCLRAISSLNLPARRFETVVVDDGTESNLKEVFDRFTGRINLRTIKQNNSGPSRARNAGAKVARGDFLAFTDDDCEPDENWLNVLGDSLTKNPDCIVGGRTLNALDNNIYSTTSQLICDLVYEHLNVNSRDAKFFCTNNMALARQKFCEIGGFDERFKAAEDRDFCHRWLAKGLKMIYCPQAIVRHGRNLNLCEFMSQHFNYGRGSFMYREKNEAQNMNNYISALRFNYNPMNLVVYPLSKNKGFRGASILVLMLLWQIMNTSGFLYELANHKINRKGS